LFKDQLQDKDKDLSSKDKDKNFSSKDKDKDCIVKDKNKDKDCILVLKESLRTRKRTRTNITVRYGTHYNSVIVTLTSCMSNLSEASNPRRSP